MTATPQTPTTRYTLAHPTDLSEEGGIAFRHALALATASDSRFYAVHVDTERKVATQLPRPDAMLAMWADAGNEVAEVSRGRLEYVLMNHTCCEDTIDTLLDALEAIEPDMLVVGTHQRDGAARFIKESVSEVVASHAGRPTLFVPLAGRGFVDERTGRVSVDNVLVPVADQAAASRGMHATQRILDRVGARDVTYTLVHVGPGNTLDHVLAPEGVGARVERVQVPEGKLTDAIVDVAQEIGADLIAMPTQGHDSLRDWLLGSRTERVVRRSPCPVLVFDL
jgi:nucleotide-binding universal stress UspA family protein